MHAERQRSVEAGLHPLRALSLASIEAIGFDLDHTLAAYDDAALNLLAAEETVGRLVADYGHPEVHVREYAAVHSTSTRTLGLDLVHGAGVKVAPGPAVAEARLRGTWMDEPGRRSRFSNPAAEGSLWQFHSPFDLPVLWFYEALAGRVQRDLATLTLEIRRSLDAVHTRGDLKPRIARDLTRYVSPAGRVRETLQHLAGSGRQIFVVTNSHYTYAAQVLDIAVGSDWPAFFRVVVTDAHKPAFFQHANDRASRTHAHGPTTVLEGSHASSVEQALGVSGERILYLGDSVRADVVAARGFGWRAGAVVPEYGAEVESPWGGLFRHRGGPTWFAHALATQADLVCDRVDRLASLARDAQLEPDEAFRAFLTGHDPA